MNKLRIMLLILVGIVILEFVVIYETNTVYMQLKPEIQVLKHNAKTYTMEWDGGNSTLTLISPTEHITIPLTNGQQFVCNRSTSLYVGKRLIFQVP